MRNKQTISIQQMNGKGGARETIRDIELAEMKKTGIPDYRTGDTLKIARKIKEGDKFRIQTIQGTVIAKSKTNTPAATVTLLRNVAGTSMTILFRPHSPLVDSVEILSRGDVRKSKLHYLIGKQGKALKIKAKLNPKV